MTTRKEHEANIAAHPKDARPHAMFADFLDEHGLDEEAAYHRRWTIEVARAEEWIRDFASKICDYDYDENENRVNGKQIFSFEKLMELARNFVGSNSNAGRWHGDYCLPFDTPDFLYSESTEFWRQYEIATGTETGDLGVMFRCAC